MKLQTIALTLLVALQGCSGQQAGDEGTAQVPAQAQASAIQTPVAAQAPVQVPGGTAMACNRVDASQMTAILGTAMTAVANDETPGVTACSYSPSSGVGPSVEFMVSSGDGPATLQSVTEMKNYDPEPAKAYAGIGDRADVLGGAVVIQDGEDLVSIRLTGVSDPPAVARKIFLAAHGTKP